MRNLEGRLRLEVGCTGRQTPAGGRQAAAGGGAAARTRLALREALQAAQELYRL